MELHMLFLSSILTISFFIATFPISHCQQDEGYWSSCQKGFYCGTVKDIGYPFWSESDYPHPQRPRYCGGSHWFGLLCDDNQYTSIQFDSQRFNVVSIDQSAYSITVVRADLISDPCSSDLTNISFGKQSNVFHYESNVVNLTLFYDCPQQISIGQKAQNKFSCQSQTGSGLVFYGNDTQLQRLFSELQHCKRGIQVPISGSIGLDPGGDTDALLKALNKGFDVKYSVESESRCSSCRKSEGAVGVGYTMCLNLPVIAGMDLTLLTVTIPWLLLQRDHHLLYSL